ncbi:MAG: hypothetical protein ABI382_06590 [Nakamurella sp.]
MSSAHLVVLRRAFEMAGTAIRPELTVIFDVRRYLPRGSGQINGNFITGLSIPNGSLGEPRQVSLAIRAQTHSGRALAALLAGVLLHWTRARHNSLSCIAPRNAQARLMFSSLGISRALQELPWKTDVGHRICAFITEPARPEHVTVVLIMVGGVVHLTASFHSNVFDEDAVRQALALAASDPLWLLDGDRSRAAVMSGPASSDASGGTAEAIEITE